MSLYSTVQYLYNSEIKRRKHQNKHVDDHEEQRRVVIRVIASLDLIDLTCFTV